MKITKEFFKKNFPIAKRESYKNINGKVLIIAGSKSMQGAGLLNVLSAYLSGAGMVAICAPQEVITEVICCVPESLVCPLKKNCLTQIKKYIKSFDPDVILIGSGLEEPLANKTYEILNFANKPAVIDASSLTALSKKDFAFSTYQNILTPHIGEMRRLLKIDILPLNSAKELANKVKAICLLKGPKTIVSDGIKTYFSVEGNEGLAKAGSGDVLGGIIATIYAKLLRKQDSKSVKEKAFLATCLGVFLQGKTADNVAKKIGKVSLRASDVADYLPNTLKSLLK